MHFYNFGTCCVEKNAAMLAAEIKLLMDSIFLPIIVLLALYVLNFIFGIGLDLLGSIFFK
tara:strand:+ start:294 stop:473 length:180 start_codon:yes stop_codon:yes gene_type:complete